MSILDNWIHAKGYRFARAYTVPVSAEEREQRFALFEYRRGRPYRVGTAEREIDAEMWEATSK